MKKIFLLLIALILSISLFGCKKEKNKLYETPELKTYEILDGACKNLIIFIGDGMGIEHIKSGEVVYDTKYDFATWNQTFSDTFSYDTFSGECATVTDSAAGGTAIATGEVTINGFVGKDYEGNDLATILDYAKAMGKSTGVVTTDTLTGATPSDFSAHAIDRSLSQEIIDTQIKSNIDILIGEYSEEIDNRKKDITSCGYKYISSYDSVKEINDAKKAYCQFHFEESEGEVSLKDAVEVAVNFLSKNENGYCLMVEQAHIDKFSHNNNFEGAVKAVNSLNNTVEYAKSVSNSNTGIIITADHETGGIKATKENIFPNQYEDVYYRFLSTSHSGENVPLFVYGFDVNFSEFSTVEEENLVKNKDIFKIGLYALTGQK